MNLRTWMITLAGFLVFMNEGVALAQSSPDTRARVSASLTGLLGNGGPRPGFSLSAGYLLSRNVGFEFDAGYTTGLGLGADVRNTIVPAGGALFPGDTRICLIPEGCPVTQRLHDHANLFTVTTNAVVEIPTATPWFLPYFAAGGGAGNLSRPIDYISVGEQQGTTRRNRETSAMLDAGAGVDFPASGGFSVGIDARYFHFFGNDSKLNFARLSARLSYRF